MKGFFIEVSNNLLDPKHCQQMGDAVWLFMWLIDKITVINKDDGKVLGGKPIKYKDIVTDLGISRSTYNRWLKTLKDAGYVKTLRTPYGSCIVVLKAKKRFNKKENNDSDVSKMTHVIRSVKSETSPASDMTHQSSDNDTSLPPSSSDNDTSNKTLAGYDITVDKTIITSRPSGDGSSSGESLAISSPVSEGSIINDAIALFLPLFPGDFVGKSSAFARPPTRKAVEALLKRYTIDELKALIKKYDDGKGDQFRPQVGTVYEFCTTKLAKVEAFVAKKSGGLWAHKSISTPEQSAVRDEQYKGVIDAGRERMRKAREEWEREHPKN